MAVQELRMIDAAHDAENIQRIERLIRDVDQGDGPLELFLGFGYNCRTGSANGVELFSLGPERSLPGRLALESRALRDRTDKVAVILGVDGDRIVRGRHLIPER